MLGILVPLVRAGLSRVLHDILLLGICPEILFSYTSNIPNCVKSFETTVPPHAYYSTHVFQMFSALKTVSGNARLTGGLTLLS